jgi:hypothetical protein
MKTPEEILKRGTGNFIHCTDYEDAIEAMIEYGNQMYNEALCWAANNAMVISERKTSKYDPRPFWEYKVDKESILKGKI